MISDDPTAEDAELAAISENTTKVNLANHSATVLRGASQLLEYLEGNRTVFDLALDLSRGTDFQQRVWRYLLQIPFGHTCSYGDIASSLGREGSERAVGTANGKNPIAIIVPCHRVITSTGSLGGYFYGTEMKRRLLEMEAEQTPRGLFAQF